MWARAWRRGAIWVIIVAAVAGIGLTCYAWWTRPRPCPPNEIFRGIIYTCEEMNRAECHGLMHLVRVDLAAPGIGLYLTPLDPEAVSQGYQYRLADPATVLRREDLAVVINGAFFSANSGLFDRTGDLANGVQTIIADGEVSHVDPHSYMLWFEPDLTPHLELTKPPDDAVLHRARWGIGGGAVSLWKGHVNEGATNHVVDRRTAVAIDPGRRLLWLAVFECLFAGRCPTAEGTGRSGWISPRWGTFDEHGAQPQSGPRAIRLADVVFAASGYRGRD